MMPGRGPAYALLGLAGLLLAIAVSSGWSGATRLADREDDRGAVGAAAAAFVTAYGSFDFRNPDGYTARLVELTAGELRTAITEAAVDPAAVAQQRASTTRIESVSVTALSDVAATATVRATHERSWRDAASGALVQEHVMQHVSLRLVREGERWLVAELLVLGEEAGGAQGAR
ncbi:MAG: hypothetical protein GEV04_22495 [Actinophytocola sp.]|nr:hypothetical protein [Actinophytocola sp.]